MRFGDLGQRKGSVDREPEPPGLDEFTYPRECVEGVTVGESVAEPHAVLLRTVEVGKRYHVLRAAGQVDELGQDAASGDIEGRVDAAGGQGADPLDHAFAVRHGLRAQQAEVVLVGSTGGADHARAARGGELDGRAADPAGGAVDEQRASAFYPQLVDRARGRLECDRESGGIDEPE